MTLWWCFQRPRVRLARENSRAWSVLVCWLKEIYAEASVREILFWLASECWVQEIGDIMPSLWNGRSLDCRARRHKTGHNGSMLRCVVQNIVLRKGVGLCQLNPKCYPTSWCLFNQEVVRLEYQRLISFTGSFVFHCDHRPFLCSDLLRQIRCYDGWLKFRLLMRFEPLYN